MFPVAPELISKWGGGASRAKRQFFCLEHQVQNTGGALAVTKWLVGQVKGLVGNFPAGI